MRRSKALGFGLNKNRQPPVNWYDDAAYADMAVVADFNNDRYAITTVALGSIAAATAVQLKVKRASTFAEIFAYTAASVLERTYTDVFGNIVSDRLANIHRLTFVNGKRQLRLENAATNLCLQSAFGGTLGTTWGLFDTGTLTQNSALAPDRSLTAATLLPDTTNGTHTTNQALAGSASTTYTVSCYFKRGFGQLDAGLQVNATGGVSTASAVNFVLDGNGSVGTPAALAGGGLTGFAGTITPCGNGWYRATITFTTPVGTNALAVFVVTYSGTNRSFAGNGVWSVYAWGAQVEQNLFATDYIPTTTGSVTRAAEAARFSPTVEAILQRAANSIVVRHDSSVDTTGLPRIIGADTSTALIRLGGNTTTVLSTGGITLSATIGSGSTRNPMGAAMGFDGAGRSIVANGGTVATDANAAATRTTVYLGRAATVAAGEYGDGYYDFVAILPERRTDVQLQALAVAA